MAISIGRGDWVQAVKSSPVQWPYFWLPRIHEGRVYFVEAVHEAQPHPEACPCNVPFIVEIAGAPTFRENWSWCGCLFRPLGGGERVERKTEVREPART